MSLGYYLYKLLTIIENENYWDGKSIPFRSDRQYDPIAIADYLRYKWLGKGWVNISPGLQEAITGKLVEIYLNAFEHSQQMNIFNSYAA